MLYSEHGLRPGLFGLEGDSWKCACKLTEYFTNIIEVKCFFIRNRSTQF